MYWWHKTVSLLSNCDWFLAEQVLGKSMYKPLPVWQGWGWKNQLCNCSSPVLSSARSQNQDVSGLPCVSSKHLQYLHTQCSLHMSAKHHSTLYMKYCRQLLFSSNMWQEFYRKSGTNSVKLLRKWVGLNIEGNLSQTTIDKDQVLYLLGKQEKAHPKEIWP